MLLETQEKPQGGVPLTHTAPGIGADLYLAGYARGPLQAWRGRAVSTSAPIGSRNADWMNATGGAISGDSGGPVLDSTGNYVGPLWGSSGSTTIFSNAGKFQGVIGRFRERINNWHTQGYGCFGGQCPPSYGGGGGYSQPPSQGGGSGRVPVENNPEPITPLTPPAQQQPPQNNSGCPCEKPRQIGCDCKCEKGEKGERGEIGLQGPMGPQGPRGPAAEITDEQLALISAAVYQKMQSDPKFRGPQGLPGEITDSQIQQIKAEVLASLPSLRVLLVDGSTGTVIDDETYRPGEPLVLDFQRVINAARQR